MSIRPVSLPMHTSPPSFLLLLAPHTHLCLDHGRNESDNFLIPHSSLFSHLPHTSCTAPIRCSQIVGRNESDDL